MTIQTLILAPHIDDEVLGCFSFLSCETFVLWFGTACFGTSSSAALQTQAKDLAQNLDFDFQWLDHPVNEYQIQPLIGDIERAIATHQPKTLLLPHPSYNQDHRQVYEAGITASRHHDRHPFIPRILVYEQVHAALWNQSTFQPQYFKSICMDAKLNAWDLLPSQHRQHRSPKHIATLAAWRGLQADTNYAEAFQVRRWVAV